MGRAFNPHVHRVQLTLHLVTFLLVGTLINRDKFVEEKICKPSKHYENMNQLEQIVFMSLMLLIAVIGL